MATKTKAKARKQGRPKGSKNQYDVNLSKSIQEIVGKRKRFVHQREIAKALAKAAKVKEKDEEQFGKKTSVLIQSLIKRNLLSAYARSSSTRERFYGLPAWMKKGKPVSTYAPAE